MRYVLLKYHRFALFNYQGQVEDRESSSEPGRRGSGPHVIKLVQPSLDVGMGLWSGDM